ncbi:3-hydroxypropanoate dehydrogenase [Antricoccus suffuscus]|uniref:3-hydroxypropanoate dehydrogenase n=1 Tax=Antricoccus suffuscus TaxID=1629062 RepID=A0A2T1A711_9ACTN|nr:malonic semialdehyde reductase [Antricoccus suffuscus]PRZ44386.1 3-hydroxypropanoate dehydrogenase [Antricoccus suffuscus]
MSTQTFRDDILTDESRDLLFHNARTANSFTDEPVTDEQLQAIYDLVKWAPTSMNIQPLRIVAVRTPQARQTLVDALSDGNKAKTLAAPLTLVVAADTEFHENLPTQFPHFPGAKDLFADNPERDQIAKMNATLQVGYLILGIRAEGLAAGPMTGGDFAQVDADFFPEGTAKTLAVINVGKPADNAWMDRLPRLAYDEVVRTA